jgi:hypothetical protein
MKVKAIINKSGSGSVNVRIPLPANIAKELNINSNNIGKTSPTLKASLYSK